MLDTVRYNRLAHWYKWVTWFGIFLNSLFIFPLLFAPRFFLSLLGLHVDPIIWGMLPGMLLLWISVFYIPATVDLKKYRVYAWLAIFPSRVGGATFCLGAVLFFNQPAGFLSIGLVDLFILLWQLNLLLRIRDAENPPSEAILAERRRSHRKWATTGVALVLLIAAMAWYKLFREEDQRFTSIQDYFRYGSIGTENQNGIPYWIWLTLPRIFPEYLPGPGGYNSLGIYSEPCEAPAPKGAAAVDTAAQGGAEGVHLVAASEPERGAPQKKCEAKSVPVGFSVKKIGFDRVGINCALCHTASVRYSADEAPILLNGAAANTFDALGYQRFLFSSASDPRFNSDTLLSEIDRIYKLPLLDKAMYRYVLIPATRRALLKQKEVYAWTESRPYWGRGRIDPFNPVKANLLHVDVGDTIGNSDMEPIWNLGAVKNRAFHWDGLNNDLHEVMLSSALGDGATQQSLPADLQKLQDWLSTLQPPKYPSERFPIDATLSARGQAVFGRDCASCHAHDGARTGQVIPLEEIGTDPHRLKIWTPEAARAYNKYANFTHFRSTSGYVAVPLDGLWTRAPYLHNGSVATLRDLLQPPAERPKVFYRGYDVFDPKNVGFITNSDEARRTGFRFDTAVSGNSNQGHLWGTTLSPDEKEAVLEYLKNL